MATSKRKIAANRLNAQKSTGPTNKTFTRFNATAHGLLSEGITEIDDADGYRDTLRRLREVYFDEIDAFLVRRIALCMVRLRRTPRLEAELVTSILHPTVYGVGDWSIKAALDKPTVIDPGQPARIDSKGVEDLVRCQRYESALENKLYRAMNQLERIRRIQQGEHLPAPVAVDVALHSESPGVDSLGEVPSESAQRGHEVRVEGADANDASEQPPDVSDSTKATKEPD